MSLRILYNRRRSVETHRLIVQQAGIKFRRAMHFQICAAVSENGETDRVRFGKPVKGERRDRLNDFVDLVRRNAFAFHRRAQFRADFIHPFF